MKTVEFAVSGKTARRLASFLVAESAWFEVEPYPDGEYRLRVKADRAPCVRREIDRLAAGARGFHAVGQEIRYRFPSGQVRPVAVLANDQDPLWVAEALNERSEVAR